MIGDVIGDVLSLLAVVDQLKGEDGLRSLKWLKWAAAQLLRGAGDAQEYFIQVELESGDLFPGDNSKTVLLHGPSAHPPSVRCRLYGGFNNAEKWQSGN